MSQKIPCRSKKAFTLVEILIVMLIVAILATIGVSAFMSSQKKGRDSKRKTDLAQLQRGLEAYINDYGTYPTSDAQGRIVGCGDNDTACQWGEAFYNSGNETTYLAQLPKDTSTGQQYYYEFVEPNGYRIYGRLENTADLAIPSTGQYSTICGSGETKYCNYTVTSENVSNPAAFTAPTSTPTATSAPTSSPTPICKSDGATCSLASECCSNNCTTFYLDQDGDTYGKDGTAVKRCGTAPPSGYASNNTDCYDYNLTAAPRAKFAFPGSSHCDTLHRGDGKWDYNCDEVQNRCGTTYYINPSCSCEGYSFFASKWSNNNGTCDSQLGYQTYGCHAYNRTLTQCGQQGSSGSTPINGYTAQTVPITACAGPGGGCRTVGQGCWAIYACTGYLPAGTTGTQGCN